LWIDSTVESVNLEMGFSPPISEDSAMSDPRLNGGHLSVMRHFRYDEAIEKLLNNRGWATAMADRLARFPLSLGLPVIAKAPPAGGVYQLLSLDDGSQHRLRVGINAIGRMLGNNLVIDRGTISRRHCVIVVHATGGCEIYDTASLNGTWVNCCKVDRVDLLPGDIVNLPELRFLVVWTGPEGDTVPEVDLSEASECHYITRRES
jgi:FHA domain